MSKISNVMLTIGACEVEVYHFYEQKTNSGTGCWSLVHVKLKILEDRKKEVVDVSGPLQGVCSYLYIREQQKVCKNTSIHSPLKT